MSDQTSKRPNILFITSDQQRGDCYGFAGRGVQTPHLDGLARDGTRLKSCITPNPVCMPARASILTGMLPLSHGLVDNGFDLNETLAERGWGGTLSKSGYDTASIGKAHLSAKRTLKATGRPECRHSSPDYPEDWCGPYMGFDHVELMVHGNLHRSRPPDRPPSGQHFERWFFSRGKGDEAYESWAGMRDDGNPTPKTWHSTLPPAWHSSTWVGDRAIERIKNRDANKPFALWVSFVDPHYAFDCPLPWSLLHDPETVAISQTHCLNYDGRPWYHRASMESTPQAPDPEEQKWRLQGSRMDTLTDRQLRKLTANYFGMISLIDHNVGRILSVLQDEGLEDNTLVVYTSDHGDLLGDHGHYQKGPMPYEGLINVGAVVRGPGVKAGQVVDKPTSTLDFAETFYDYAGASARNEGQGRSLRTLLEGRDETRDAAYAEWRMMPYRTGIELDLRIVRTARYTMAVDLLTGAGELYDNQEDPLQYHNLFDDPGTAAVRRELQDMLHARSGPLLTEFGEMSAPGGS